MNFIQHPVWISDQGNRRFEDYNYSIIIVRCNILFSNLFSMRAYFNPTSAISVQSCYTLASHKEIKRSQGHPGAPGFGATSPIIAIPPARIIDPPVGYLFFLSFLPSSLFLAKRTHFARKCNGFRFCREVLYKVFLSSLSIIAGAIAWLRHEKRWSKRRFKVPSRNNSSFEGQLSHNAVLYISFECVNGHVEFKTKNWRFGERGGNGG